MRTKRDAIFRLISLIAGCILVVVLMALQLPSSEPSLSYDVHTTRAVREKFEYYNIRCTVWNNGQVPVLGRDQHAPLTLAMEDADEVFFLHITGVSGTDNGLSLAKRLAENETDIRFDHLNPGDQFTVQLYAYRPLDIVMTGDAAMVKPLDTQRVIPPVMGIPFYLFTVILFAAMVMQMAYIAARLIRWPGGEQWQRIHWRKLLRYQEPERYEQRRRTRLGIWIWKYWPIFYTTIWVLCYCILFVVW